MPIAPALFVCVVCWFKVEEEGLGFPISGSTVEADAGEEMRLSVSTVESVVTFADKSVAKSADEFFDFFDFFPFFDFFLEDFVVQPSSLGSTFDFGALPSFVFFALFAPFLPFFADLVFVGASEGNWEGEHDGSDEGISDGADDNDGWSEGKSVGLCDGLIDGISDGNEDGIADGSFDGMEDGIIDGFEDGFEDGSFEGIEDGIIDGNDVGLCPKQGFPSKSIAESAPYFIVNFILPEFECFLQEESFK